ncbi:MAG: tetratricopeptide repeat protein [Planctomycetia bacterium]|nr:tetratricopeptide repeat protein [Planctomycetia bacterium]
MGLESVGYAQRTISARLAVIGMLRMPYLAWLQIARGIPRRIEKLMESIFMRPFVSLLVLLSASVATGQEYKVGDKVVVIKNETPVKGEKEVVNKLLAGETLIVRAIDGITLQVSGRKSGWIMNENVVTFDKSIDYFTQAIANDSNNTTLLYGRGLIWTEKGELEKAIADYTEVIRIEPNSVKAFTGRGYARSLKHDYVGAISDHTQAIRLAPNNVTAYQGRGNDRNATGDFDGAIADFDKGIQVEPHSTGCYCGRGVAKQSKRDYDGAIADYTEVIRLDPTFVRAFDNRGIAREAKQDFNGAIADYSEAIRLDPKNATGYWGLGLLMASCPDSNYRNGEKAVTNMKMAVSLLSEKDGNVLEGLAAAYAEAGNFDEAIKWQSKALDLAPEMHKATFRTHLDLFKQHRPYRGEVKK